MIAWLRGRVRHREAGWGILDVRGVGYEIHAPGRALDRWAAADADVEVFVATQVREDAIALYAFPTAEDRRAFQVLLGVSGVGPKLALACLDALPLDALARAVAAHDVAALARVPGIGKKTAQRMALELEGKLPAPAIAVRAESSEAPPPLGADTLELALRRLGYTRPEIAGVLEKLPALGLGPDTPVQDRLKGALRILYGGP